ncbi:MAG: hypothetical protein QM441_04005 [Synergistota bacterium]|jgi:hypothetical protein|nr:hypothetical protein [Synergistota bacterium]
MFIPLEGEGLISIHRIVALVRQGGGTVVHLRDGTVLTTGFRPETLAKRYNSFRKEAIANARAALGRPAGGSER